jgi:SAM-dependent methyltransferase
MVEHREQSETRPCPICGSPAFPAGTKRGRRTRRIFSLRQCGDCGYAFVEDPWTDYANIYDEDYYRGRGSDPMVDFAFEVSEPGRTIRRYEWAGIERAVRSLAPGPAKWLDFGSGNGGLVRHLRSLGYAEAYGHDTGAWSAKAKSEGIPILNAAELEIHAGTFDVITAIEVLEHLVDPLEALGFLRRLAKPGALLFATTGNAATAPARLCNWAYAEPEIHVSYFTPRSLGLAMRRCGFEPFYPGRVPGWEQIIRYKLLKNLGMKRTGILERALPWSWIAPFLDRKYGLTAQPAGRAV